MVMHQAEQQGLIGLCCEVGGEQRNNEDIYLQRARSSSCLNYCIQRDGREEYVPVSVSHNNKRALIMVWFSGAICGHPKGLIGVHVWDPVVNVTTGRSCTLYRNYISGSQPKALESINHQLKVMTSSCPEKAAVNKKWREKFSNIT